MSMIPSVRHPALVALLLFSAALLAAPSVARADAIYQFTDSQADRGYGGSSGMDIINASLTVSGTTVTAASFSITTSSGTVFSEPNPIISQTAPVSVVGDHLELPNFTWLTLQSGPVYRNGDLLPLDWGAYMVLQFRHDSSNGSQYTGSTQNIHNHGIVTPDFLTTTFPAIDSGNGNWIIGTAVPEPSTFVLLGSAMLGLGIVYLRRHRAEG